MFKFDHDWFSQNIPNLELIFSRYTGDTGEEKLRILEIGTFEGQSTLWFLKCIKNSHVTTIDTWFGGKDHDQNNREIDWLKVKSNFDYNISQFYDRVNIMHMTSYEALTKLIEMKTKPFDFIYIDGSHTAADVNLDAILSFKLLKISGLMYCDDYLWGLEKFNLYDCPKIGIDAFASVYGNKQLPIIGLKNNAAVFMKVEE